MSTTTTFQTLDESTPTADFVALVEATPDDALAEAMTDDGVRDRIVDVIFGQMEQRFRPERARGLEAVVHWKISYGEDGLEHREVRIEGTTCTVSADPQEKPNVTFEVGIVPFLRMIAGQTSGMKLMIGRKLRVRGDMMLAPRIEQLFKTDPDAV